MRWGASKVKMGILAVQGDFEGHGAMLARFDTESVEVRTPADLEGCDGLILPGGESTTQLQFLQEEGLADAIGKFAEQRGAIFGDRKSTRLNSSHGYISYAVFCLKKKRNACTRLQSRPAPRGNAL